MLIRRRGRRLELVRLSKGYSVRSRGALRYELVVVRIEDGNAIEIAIADRRVMNSWSGEISIGDRWVVERTVRYRRVIERSICHRGIGDDWLNECRRLCRLVVDKRGTSVFSAIVVEEELRVCTAGQSFGEFEGSSERNAELKITSVVDRIDRDVGIQEARYVLEVARRCVDTRITG